MRNIRPWTAQLRRAAIRRAANRVLILGILGFPVTSACSAPLKCVDTKVSYWRDSKELTHPYKISVQCIETDGTKTVITPVTSATKISTACKKADAPEAKAPEAKAPEAKETEKSE